jgi:hypothetical protein
MYFTGLGKAATLCSISYLKSTSLIEQNENYYSVVQAFDLPEETNKNHILEKNRIKKVQKVYDSLPDTFETKTFINTWQKITKSTGTGSAYSNLAQLRILNIIEVQGNATYNRVFNKKYKGNIYSFIKQIQNGDD